MKKTKFITCMIAIIIAVILCINKINVKIQEEKKAGLNYQYIVYSNNQEQLKKYKHWFPDKIDLTWETHHFITPTENMITYQDAANIAGYALENIYGLTKLFNHCGVIQLYNYVVYNRIPTDSELNLHTTNISYNQPHRYVYMYYDDNGVRYTAKVDRYSGMVFQVGKDISFVAGQTADITTEQQQQVISLLQEYTRHLNLGAEISITDISHTINTSNLSCFVVNGTLSDNYKTRAVIYKPDGEGYQLVSFSVLESIQY